MTAPIADWTIMIYVAADNVAANFAVESLKQLRRAAGAGVAVVAQFDAAGKRDISRLAFAGGDDITATLERNRVGTLSRSVDMTDPETLVDFVNWASRAYTGNHYCLFLWGHGCQLFLDETRAGEVDQATPKPARSYLTPANLRKALENTELARQGKKLDVIGFDACSMSLVEVACELQSCVNFMIASQEAIPYTSFPYEQLVQTLKDAPDDVEGTCVSISKLYKQAYHDYLVPPGMEDITLSSLRLQKIHTISEPLCRLANVLLSSVPDKNLRTTIIRARSAARDFSSGLFVDLFDFCEQLAGTSSANSELRSACQEVCAAISMRGESACVIENQTSENSRCHGLSIYFPYLKDAEADQEEQGSLEESHTEIGVEMAEAFKKVQT